MKPSYLLRLCLLSACVLAGCSEIQPTQVEKDSPVKPSSDVVAIPQQEDLLSSPDTVSPDTVSPDTVSPDTGDPTIQPSDVVNSPSTQNTHSGAPAEILNRPFVTIQPVESSDPLVLIDHLRAVDEAIGDLVLAGSNNIIEKDIFIEGGMRLGNMKLKAGELLANSSAANAEQRKSGVLAQLVALSHMSGIGDVASAKQLESLARSLVESGEPDLAHQSRVVLIGFELQALQNGVSSDPNELLMQSEGLFQRAEDRGFPEFMMLQQGFTVLAQMGFSEASERMKNILIAEYQNAADPQLRGEAWLLAARDSQALANFNQALSSLDADLFDSQTLLAATRGLYEAFPTDATLEKIASMISAVEYGGNITASQQLADFIQQKIDSDRDSVSIGIARELLAGHRSRIGLIGKPLDLTNILGFDGATVDWKVYEGKVVLVDFWATWCLPCLQEMPNIRSVHKELVEDGFAVIGVNMDDDPESAREFVNRQDFPWRNFYFDGPAGFQSEFAKRTGLNMIPFIVLIGPDGNVAGIHVRGTKIATAVKDLLQPSLIP